MMDEESMFSPETFVSPYTNRPVTARVENPIFWCDICCLKLSTARVVIQHMTGRHHKAMVRAKDNPKRKRGLDSSNVKPADPPVQQPATKKSKEELSGEVVSDPNLKCEDCNLVFVSPVLAIQHFKGKKHASAITAKIAAKQRAGRGRGGRGRGDGFGRGHDFMPGRYNSGLGSGAAAGQLIRALKNFYGEPLNFNAPSINPNHSGGSSNYYNNGYGRNSYSTSNDGYWKNTSPQFYRD